MPFIGREPTYGTFEVQTLSADGNEDTFLLDYKVSDPASLLVVINGAVQKPKVAYDLTNGGSSIAFVTAPSNGANVFLVYLGKQYLVPTLSDGSIDRDMFDATLKRSVIGQWVEVSSNASVGAGSNIILDTTSAEITLTLPASPVLSDTVKIVDGAGNCSVNNCIINPNGNKIMGSTDNYVIAASRESLTLVYYNSTNGWVVVDNHNFIT